MSTITKGRPPVCRWSAEKGLLTLLLACSVSWAVPASAQGEASRPAQAAPAPQAAPAGAPPAAAGAYVPDARFLSKDPNRKTKQHVRLTGVKSDSELKVVRSAIEDIVVFVRLFGISGNNWGDHIPKGFTAEEVARIKEAPQANKKFQEMSTPNSKGTMPIVVASGNLAMAIDEWIVESDSALSVRVNFQQSFLNGTYNPNPPPHVVRLRFIRQDGRWMFDGAQTLQKG